MKQAKVYIDLQSVYHHQTKIGCKLDYRNTLRSLRSMFSISDATAYGPDKIKDNRIVDQLKNIGIKFSSVPNYHSEICNRQKASTSIAVAIDAINTDATVAIFFTENEALNPLFKALVDRGVEVVLVSFSKFEVLTKYCYEVITPNVR